jgi:hypothetical protein
MAKMRLTMFVAALVATLCLAPALSGPSSVFAQEKETPPPKKDKEKDKEKEKDEALDRLLDKLDGNKTAENEKKEDTKKEEPKKEAGADKATPKAKTETPPPPKAKKPADVSGKDKALDSLLEKLGETEDKPSPDDRRPPPPGGMPPPDSEKNKEKDKGPGQKPDPQSLTGKDKATDEHLEELTGKPRKKKPGEDGDGNGNSPLTKVIKEMREVEERLGKPDTGDETRQKQKEIVKNLETLIDQMRSSSAQQKMRKTQKQIAGMKPGQQPDGQNTDPGNTGGNAPHQKPKTPESNRTPIGGKDVWGHLPPELRQDMENVFTEDFLPRKKDKINRYFLDLTKKSVTRNRGE